ncbi:Replication factor C small subunit [Entamoeba marina]
MKRTHSNNSNPLFKKKSTIDPTPHIAYIPLPQKVRPTELTDIIGQESAVGKNTPLWTMIEKDKMRSVIIYGPPGCGKTTIAQIIRQKTKCKKKGINTILFVDEIHTLNKLQQDTFLSAVESGAIILIGATTQNPSFELNSALLSRCDLVILNRLSINDIARMIRRAIELEYKNSKIELGEESIKFLAAIADGDGRNALNGVEKVFSHFEKLSDEEIREIILKASHEDEQEKTIHDQKETEMTSSIITTKTNDSNTTSSTNRSTISKQEISKMECIDISSDSGDSVVAINSNKECNKSKQEESKDSEKDVNENNKTTESTESNTNPTEKIELTRSDIQESSPQLNNQTTQPPKFLLPFSLIEQFLQRSLNQFDRINYDRNLITNALLKSIRGSDENATVYWVVRLLAKKEDPKFIGRKLIESASTDVGLADTNALIVAIDAFKIATFLGYPDCEHALILCAVYLARAKKSVVVDKSLSNAKELVERTGSLPVPLHIREGPNKLSKKKMGYGVDYKYPPFFDHVLDQTYLPQSIIDEQIMVYDRFVLPLNKDEIIIKPYKDTQQ